MEENLCSTWRGWQCPICKRVYSPFTKMCLYCGNNEIHTNLEYFDNTGGFVKVNSSDFKEQTKI